MANEFEINSNPEKTFFFLFPPFFDKAVGNYLNENLIILVLHITLHNDLRSFHKHIFFFLRQIKKLSAGVYFVVCSIEKANKATTISHTLLIRFLNNIFSLRLWVYFVGLFTEANHFYNPQTESRHESPFFAQFTSLFFQGLEITGFTWKRFYKTSRRIK